MKLFLDTANVDEIREAASWGILDGVTTNPTLVAKSGRPFKDVIHEICAIVDGPISAEVTDDKAPAMMLQAREYAAWHRNVVIKIPMCEEGLKAVNQCKKEGIKTNVTLVFSANQALLAAKAGATMMSPFVGRLDDISHEGMAEIYVMRQIYDNYGIETEILAASIRHPLHVIEAAKAGADIATLPYAVLKQMVKHPLTDLGIERFLKDWESVKKLSYAKVPA
jgi:transaldolase